MPDQPVYRSPNTAKFPSLAASQSRKRKRGDAMSTTILVNGLKPEGTSLRVTGNKRSKPALKGASITVQVQQAVYSEDGRTVQGTATLKNVEISGIANWELVVPSNEKAGTFVAGAEVYYNVTAKDSTGNTAFVTEGTRTIGGGLQFTADRDDFVQGIEFGEAE
jgi:hypothetical protein